MLCRNSLRVGAPPEIVEFTTLYSRDEGRDLGSRIDQRRSPRMPRVAYRDVSTCELCQFDAVAARVADRALAPDERVRLQMHVQMFTHQHLRMQGRIDTIVLRHAGTATHGTGRRWVTRGGSALRGRTGYPSSGRWQKSEKYDLPEGISVSWPSSSRRWSTCGSACSSSTCPIARAAAWCARRVGRAFPRCRGRARSTTSPTWPGAATTRRAPTGLLSEPVRHRVQPSHSSAAAAVQDWSRLPSAAPVSGS